MKPPMTTIEDQFVKGTIEEPTMQPPADDMPGPNEKIRIIAVTSVPRLGFQDHFGVLTEALTVFGIPIIASHGVYWSHLLEGMMAKVIDIGAEWILTLDYDTLFTAADIWRMVTVLRNNPQIDALTGAQPKRDTLTPLYSVPEGANGDEPFKVRTAHFGCTLIKAAALRKVPHPWFHAVPDSNGTWEGDDRIDDDTSFWRHWEAAGNTLYIDPKVRLGHMILMVAQYVDAGHGELLTVAEWRNARLPEMTRLREHLVSAGVGGTLRAG